MHENDEFIVDAPAPSSDCYVAECQAQRPLRLYTGNFSEEAGRKMGAREFSAGESRAALGTETALVVATGKARREMVMQLALGQTERRHRHEETCDESAAGHSLAVAAVAFERHDGSPNIRNEPHRTPSRR
ncbi:MAG: hypothetical protein L0Z50_01180 [Verrucomicrobiales bacterium]|nr:hypothetical protein [Verrucomicrobiales bacterium]